MMLKQLKYYLERVPLVIDVQNDFCPGGFLALADGNALIDTIHRAAERLEQIRKQRYGQTFLQSLPPYRMTATTTDAEAFFERS